MSGIMWYGRDGGIDEWWRKRTMMRGGNTDDSREEVAMW